MVLGAAEEGRRQGAEWDGVRNFQARNNMRAMKKGDLGFFYQSGDDKAEVGIVKVVKQAHPNLTDATGQWECVDVRRGDRLPKPVMLAEIKANPALKAMVLVKTPASRCSRSRTANGARSAPWAGSPTSYELSAATSQPRVKSTRAALGRATS